VLTRYDDVVMVLRDPRFGRDGFEQVLAIDDSSISVAIGASGDEANRWHSCMGQLQCWQALLAAVRSPAGRMFTP